MSTPELDDRTPWQRARDAAEATGTWPKSWGPFHRHFASDAIHRDGGPECDQPGTPRRVYMFDPDALDEHEAAVARWAVEHANLGPTPGDAVTVAVSRDDLMLVHAYARHFDVDDDPAMIRVAAILRDSWATGRGQAPGRD